MINWIRRKLGGPFTRWYVKRGYKYGYDFKASYVHTDGIFSTPLKMPKAVWTCPWWVRPLLIFFSPSVYYTTAYSKWLIDGLLAGVGAEKIEPLSKKPKRGLRRNMPIIDEWCKFITTKEEDKTDGRF